LFPQNEQVFCLKTREIGNEGILKDDLVPEWEFWVHTPAVFVRVANKGLARYVTWKKVRKMEEQRR
jgi:hypothetical protein